MIMANQMRKPIYESGDHYEVRWTQKVVVGDGSIQSPPMMRSFVFQKDKDNFVSNLLKDVNIISVDVGIFNQIK